MGVKVTCLILNKPPKLPGGCGNGAEIGRKSRSQPPRGRVREYTPGMENSECKGPEAGKGLAVLGMYRPVWLDKVSERRRGKTEI